MRFIKMTFPLSLQFEHDTVLVPKETSWFGYYPDGAFSPLLTPQEVYICKVSYGSIYTSQFSYNHKLRVLEFYIELTGLTRS